MRMLLGNLPTCGKLHMHSPSGSASPDLQSTRFLILYLFNLAIPLPVYYEDMLLIIWKQETNKRTPTYAQSYSLKKSCKRTEKSPDAHTHKTDWLINDGSSSQRRTMKL